MHAARPISTFLITCLIGYVIALPCQAQTGTTPANPQSPSSQSLQASVDSSAATTAPVTATAPQTVTPGINTISSSSRPGSLRSAGQGLPGMPGGPPVKGPLGSQDPSPTYMRPQTIGPLFCDPLVDGVCD